MLRPLSFLAPLCFTAVVLAAVEHSPIAGGVVGHLHARPRPRRVDGRKLCPVVDRHLRRGAAASSTRPRY